MEIPKAPKTNPNLFNWSGFFKTEEEAEKDLQQKVKLIVKKYNKIIVSAKKELQVKGKKCHDLLLYKFTIITNNEK